MYGKLMSISDELMQRYILLLADAPEAYLLALQNGEHPLPVKERLATEIVSRFHGAVEAGQAAQQFRDVVRSGGIPDDLEEIVVAGPIYWPAFLAEHKLVDSRRVARDRISAGALTLDGEKWLDADKEYQLEAAVVLKFGKRNYLRLVPK